MSWHLHGTVLTDQGTAGNNRGDSEGTKSTLQKIFRNGDQFTTVSAEAIRYALREGLQSDEERDPDGEHFFRFASEAALLESDLKESADKPGGRRGGRKRNTEETPKTPAPEEEEKKKKALEQKRARLETLKKEMEVAKGKMRATAAIRLNRTMPDHKSNIWNDKHFRQWQQFFDDDVLGFMHAKEQTDSHRGIFEISRAISTTPWRGEVVANYATPGSNPGVGHNNPIPYAIEVHHTRYQYTFTFTPEALAQDHYERSEWLLNALMNLRRVGGNHAHFLFDFSPSAVVLRWTKDPAPRIMYCFDEDEHGALSLRRLKDRVDKKDVDATELWIGSVVEIEDLPSMAKACPKEGPKSVVKSLFNLVRTSLSGQEEKGRE
jgi:CRISPR-associated protein Cst2